MSKAIKGGRPLAISELTRRYRFLRFLCRLGQVGRAYELAGRTSLVNSYGYRAQRFGTAGVSRMVRVHSDAPSAIHAAPALASPPKPERCGQLRGYRAADL